MQKKKLKRNSKDERQQFFWQYRSEKKRRKNPERLLAQYQIQTIINIQALAKRVFSQIVQRDIQ